MRKTFEKEELAKLLSQKLKGLMERDRVSLHLLFTRLGINKSTLHNWINGVVSQPLYALVKIANFFDVTVDELYRKSDSADGQETVGIVNLKVSIHFEEKPCVYKRIRNINFDKKSNKGPSARSGRPH